MGMTARAATAVGLWIRPTASLEWKNAGEVGEELVGVGYVDRRYSGGFDGSRPIYDEHTARHGDDLAGPFLCEPSPNVPNAWQKFNPLSERGLGASFARIAEQRVGAAGAR